MAVHNADASQCSVTLAGTTGQLCSEKILRKRKPRKINASFQGCAAKETEKQTHKRKKKGKQKKKRKKKMDKDDTVSVLRSCGMQKLRNYACMTSRIFY